MGFKGVGRVLMVWENQPFSVRIIPWVLGASLVAHCASFLSVAYFDQMLVFWYILLAMLSFLYSLSNIKNSNRTMHADAKNSS
jgi:hypothetical protein